MRTVALDVTRIVGRALKGRLPTGIDRVGLAYVEHFETPARALLRLGNAPVLATRDSTRRLFAQLLETRSDAGRSRLKLLEAASRLVPDLTAHDPAVLVHTGHGGLERPDFLRRWRKSGGAVVSFVHDLIPLTHPEFARPGEREKHDARMRSALASSELVLVNSAATERALRSHATLVGLTPPRIVVAHLGVKPLPTPATARLVPAPYFVTVGTIEARKNHLLLLQLWRRMVETLGSATPKLLVVGQRGWECENVIDLLERCEALRDVVIEVPDASDADLATYMHYAQALLFPSFVEGYGLPLVEALSAGVPVIASDLEVFRELAGSRPTYLDPLDGLGWLRAITSVASPARGPHDRAHLQPFSAPRWSDHFAIVDAALESIP